MTEPRAQTALAHLQTLSFCNETQTSFCNETQASFRSETQASFRSETHATNLMADDGGRQAWF
ncbi:hypothetical protein DEO72_LG6g1986 [Vigna unguiculata]|uniref:Uncharacterized protein n=1 Tax=Vigna unguiculata TaxID=3917 RepID=A0A4D6MB45_VIGUN|nr:hypothetical protein DEO72_LG6g1986 [Vigna unguiculata]